MKLSGTLKDENGADVVVSVETSAIAVAAPEPVVAAPPPAPTSTIPLTFNDPRFADTTAGNQISVANGGSVLNKSLTGEGWMAASIVFKGAGSAKNCRVLSPEAVRIGGSGTVLIDGCYLEAKATDPKDHADTIQIYAPGDSGVVTIKNTMIVAHNESATAGMFVADEWSGDLVFENVAFKNGPFGLRVVEDGKDVRVSLKNVYFIGPFGWDEAFLFQDVSGKIECLLWENVRHATLENGALVPGALIPKPF